MRARIGQFTSIFASNVVPPLEEGTALQLASQVLDTLPLPDYAGASLEARRFQLVFRHDCLSLGCLDSQCVLCEHNPHRRCSVNFSNKYLVNDVLRAKCDAPIRVEVIDRVTGQPAGDALGDLTLELCILDGNQYDARCVDVGQERGEDLEACALLLNNKAQPLLLAGPGGAHTPASRVAVQLSHGQAALPDLHVSDSSEAMLSGRKPPFRLLARALAPPGAPYSIRHAVSEGFVVATRRTRTAGKVEIPNVDDHVSKLEHMGKETVKKLQDIRGSGLAAGVDVQVPDNTINKVGEFRKLALLAEADGHLRQKLQQVLKLSKEKWEEARDHAMKAVVADNRMRIWYADKSSMEVGLLFTCRLGNVDLDRPVGLLTKKAQDGAQTTMDATLMAQQTPAQREQVRGLQPAAVAAWWQANHPGWAIYPLDSEQFLATGTLDGAGVVERGPALGSAIGGAAPGAYAVAAPAPSPAHIPNGFGSAYGYHHAEPVFRAYSGDGFSASLRDAPAPVLSSSPARDGDPGASAFAAAAAVPSSSARSSQRGGADGADRDIDSGSPHGGGTPFLGAGPGDAPSQAPSFSFASLQGLFGGDLSKIPGLATGLSLGGFPSVPNSMLSGELEQLLAQHGGADALFAGAARAPSLGAIGKLESLDLPDPGAARGGGGQPPGARARRTSSLDNMASIERALAGVGAPPQGPQAVMEAAAQEYVRQQLSGVKRQPSRPLTSDALR